MKQYLLKIFLEDIIFDILEVILPFLPRFTENLYFLSIIIVKFTS